MSFKIVIALCLASVVVVNGQLPDPQKCIETMSDNIREYASELRELATNFTDTLTQESGINPTGYMNQINELTSQYMQLANSLSSFNVETIIAQGNALMEKQANLVGSLITSVRPNPTTAIKTFQFMRQVAQLNMRYLGLFSPLACLQQQDDNPSRRSTRAL